MNRLARHELAQRELRARLEKEGQVVISASTTAPCDVVSLDRRSGAPTCWEVKTAKGRKASDLSRDERTFGQTVEGIGIPFVIARYRVVGDRVVGTPDLYRPFGASLESRETEIVLEVTP
ncbi:MAG: hypothetical protein ACRECR_02200 [Thermoplasmata archaeon]